MSQFETGVTRARMSDAERRRPRGWLRPAVAGSVVLSLLAINAAPATHAQVDAVDRATMGIWQQPFWEGDRPIPNTWTVDDAAEHPAAVSTAVLPDGRILYWNGFEGLEHSQTLFDYAIEGLGEDVDENDQARILDLGAPELGDEVWTEPDPVRGTTNGGGSDKQSLFCADHKLLYDGTVLIAGGENIPGVGLDVTRIFDPVTDSFSFTDDMSFPRWYPSLVTLADGRVLALSGAENTVSPARVERDPQSYKVVREAEVYDPRDSEWREVATSPFSFPLYPRMHLIPGGTVFYGGNGSAWNPAGESADMASWALHSRYDPDTDRWETLGPARYGSRNYALSVLLRFERGAYDEARVLTAGGTLGPASTGQATTLSDITTIGRNGVITNDVEMKGWFDGLIGDESQLRNPRWHSTPVLLPSGEVLAFSGGERDELALPTLEGALRTPELYDPTTNTWRELAPAARGRTYHNTAVLLPDGRVLVGGSAPFYGSSTAGTPGLPCGDHCLRDSTFEIYSPPYLFADDGTDALRPVIDDIRVRRHGRELLVHLGSQSEEVSDLVLVRVPAVTHGLDSDQRAVALEFTRLGNDGPLAALLPQGGDGSVLPPGPYYVFALDDRGTPSVAHTVFTKPAHEDRVTFGQP